MRIILALTAIFIINMHAGAQDIVKSYSTSIDSVNGRVVYKGFITFDVLKKEPTFDWYQSGIDRYKPKKRQVAQLRKTLPRYTMVIVMGTWCGDSRDLVPKLYKVLHEASYPMDKVAVYGVDRSKTDGFGHEKTYDIHFVPTIILFDGTKEIGRITESVHKSIEADLAAIIKHYESKG